MKFYNLGIAVQFFWLNPLERAYMLQKKVKYESVQMNNYPHTCKLWLVWCQYTLSAWSCLCNILSLGSVVSQYIPTVWRLEFGSASTDKQLPGAGCQCMEQWPQQRVSAFHYPNTSLYHSLELRAEQYKLARLDWLRSPITPWIFKCWQPEERGYLQEWRKWLIGGGKR